MRRLIAIDLDGVIANCVEYALSIVNEQLNLDIKEADIWKYDLEEVLSPSAFFLFTQLIDNIDFILNQPCYEEARNFLQWLKENEWTIIIITSRPEYLRSVSMEWLKRQDFPYDFICMTDKKEKFAGICDYLIEDNPYIIKKWCKKGGKAFLIDRPYNRRTKLEKQCILVKRVKTLREIIQYLKEEKDNK